MSHIYQSRNNWFTVLYTAVRIALGSYLIYHASSNLSEFDSFYIDSISYSGQEMYQYILSCLTPFLPFTELFIGVLLTMGLYTELCLKWSMALGVLVIIFLHYHFDFQGAAYHTYLLVAKVLLLFNMYYNRWSVDYYQLWRVTQDYEIVEDKPFVDL